MSNRMTVLISGGGIGGLALAWWLQRFGFVPTVVERASALREGGYMIDFFGLGFDVAERMNLRGKLAQHDLRIPEILFVDEAGKRRGGLNVEVIRKLMNDRAVSILRSALARVLFEAVKDDIEVVFGDSVGRIVSGPHDVAVAFESGRQRNFDLVVGADGLHSRVRDIVFGEEALFERHFGYYTASFTIPDDQETATFASYTVPQKQVGVYPVGDGRLAAFFVFSSRDRLVYERGDDAAQLALLRAAFAGVGWRAPELLARASEATDFYFDGVSQIRMPSWSKDRVTLIGDACACPSLLSGQGASMAVAGAYVLAGELNQSAGGFRSAYARYQQLMKPYVDDRQRLAARFASSFVPASTLGVRVRDLTTRLMTYQPFAARFVKSFATDTLRLQDY